MMWFYHGDKAGDWLTFDAAIANPPFTGGESVGYEYTSNGVLYYREGCNVYRITGPNSFVLDHTIAPQAPVSWWRRLWAWVRSWL